MTPDGRLRPDAVSAGPGNSRERAHAVTYQAVSHLGWVWVCLGQPRADPPPFSEWDGQRFSVPSTAVRTASGRRGRAPSRTFWT